MKIDSPLRGTLNLSTKNEAEEDWHTDEPDEDTPNSASLLSGMDTESPDEDTGTEEV